jgi:hypothetical protein
MTKGKKAGNMDQAVEYLPCKHKALNSLPTTAKNNKKQPPTKFILI